MFRSAVKHSTKLKLGQTERGEEGAREEARGGRDFGEREGLQVLDVLATRLGLGVLLARHGRRELRGNRGCTSRGLAVHLEGEDVACVRGARGRAE